MKATIKEKVVVTGAAGFIGSSLSNFLTNHYSVIGIDNLSTGDWNRCNENVVKIEGSISQLEISELEEIFASAKYVFHLAAVKLHNSTNDYAAIHETNIEGSRRVFEAAVKAKVKKIIFSSSLYSYGNYGPSLMDENDQLDPKNYYGLSKVFGESLLKIISRSNNTSFAIARLFFIYGPSQYASGGYKSVIIKNMENALVGKSLEVNGDGEQSLDYVYVDDCVQILSQLADSEFVGTMNISSGKQTTINSLLKIISELSKESRIRKLETDWTHGTSRVGSTVLREKILGKREMISISEGLSKTWFWAQNNL